MDFLNASAKKGSARKLEKKNIEDNAM